MFHMQAVGEHGRDAGPSVNCPRSSGGGTHSLRGGFGWLKSMESFACSVKDKPRRLDAVLRFV